MLAAIYMVFVYVPTDKVQGIVQRIFYFHVPLAIMTFVAFGAVAVASAMFLWRGTRGVGSCGACRRRGRHAVLHAGADHRADLGAAGLGHVVDVGCAPDDDADPVADLRRLPDAAQRRPARPTRGRATPRCSGIVGAVDIPIINRSVYWWRTIHPAVLITREGGSGLADPRMQAHAWRSASWRSSCCSCGCCGCATRACGSATTVERLRQQALGHCVGERARGVSRTGERT